MKFSNFKNSETYHFFIWVSKSGYIDTQKLIFQAFEKVKDEDIRKGNDVSSMAKFNLAVALEDIIVDLSTDLDAQYYFIGELEGPETIDMLWRPLLAHAFHKIDPSLVAEALPLQAGKWVPDSTVPKAKLP